MVSHQDVLVFLIQILILLLTARGFGWLARSLNQPAVIGEIFAGVLLGPSLLSGLFPAFGHWIFSQNSTQKDYLDMFRQLGSVFLLLMTGLEIDLSLLRRHARTAMGVSFGGILIPFICGFLLGQYLPSALLNNSGNRFVFSLFLATALSISAVAVIAKVLLDLNLMRRDLGQTIIASGMTDDTVGWMLLSVVVGLAAGNAITPLHVFEEVGSVIAFFLLSFTVGRWLVQRLMVFVQNEIDLPEKHMTLVLGLTFAFGAAALAFGMEAVLGAFVAGMLLAQTARLPETARQKITAITLGVFAPIFFATAGLQVNLGDLLDIRLIAIAILVILIASVGKLTGGYLGARIVGRDHSRSLVYGIGINARGSQEVIIATIGLSAGILSRSMYTMIILMAITTSLATPAALRWALKYVKPSEMELERMKRDKIARESLVAGIHRVLIPVRRREEINHGAISIYTYLLSRIRRKKGVSTTLLNISPAIEKAGSVQYLKKLSEYFPSNELHIRVLEGNDPAQQILDEAHKDYDLIILGVQDKRTSTTVLFNPLVDYLMRNSPCPTLLVKAESLNSHWRPRRILLPTNGLPAAKNAAEMGFALAGEDSTAVVLHVIPRTQEGEILDIKGVSFERQIAAAYDMVRELCNLGEAYGVQTEPRVKIGQNPEMEILKTAQELEVDMILLGTHLRSLSDRLLLGSRVERILEHATCPVLILNSL